MLFGPVKFIVLVGMACAAILAPAAAAAQDVATFNIPAQDLAGALRAFAVTTHTEILYTPDLVADRQSKPLVGKYTPEEALRRLLADTGLSFQDAASGVLVLRRVTDPAPAVGPDASLESQTTGLLSRTGLTVGILPSESAAPGGLAGLVRDAATGTPLAGAAVRIQGTDLEAVSDDRGRYRFPEVPAGSHLAAVDYLGAHSLPMEVRIDSGFITDIDFEVGDSSVDTVVVLGYRSGIQRALNQQRTASNNSTVVSADLLGGFPAETVSEALRRVPGVAFGRADDTGEGSRITIRGFSSEAINVQLNGLDLQGTGFERTIDLSGFLADNISEVTIHKSLLPSHEATGSGGLVEIETKSGLDYGDFQFNLGMEGERNLESGFGDEQQANAILAKKLTDNFGIAATLQYRASDRRNYNVDIQDQLPAVLPSGFTSLFNVPASQQFPFDSEFNRRLIISSGYLQRDRDEEDVAASVNAAWDIADHTRLRLDLQRNVRDASTDFSRTSAGYLVGRFDMPIPELDGEIRRHMVLGSFRPSLNLASEDVEVTTQTISFRGDTNVDRWQFEYKLGYSSAVTRSEESDLSVIANPAANIENIIDPATIVMQPDDDGAATQRVADGGFIVLGNGVAVPSFSNFGRDLFFDLSQYNITSAARRISDSPTDAYIAEGSVRYDFAPGFLQYLETGFKYDRSSRDSLDDLFASPTVGNLEPFLIYADVSGRPTTLADLGGGLASNQNLGAIGAGGFAAPFLSSADGEFIFDALSNLLVDDPSTPFNEERFVLDDFRGLDPFLNDRALSPASTREEKRAGYVEAKFQFGDFDIVGGGRIEKTERTATAISIPGITLNLPGFQREPRETFVNAGLVDFAAISGTDTTITPSLLANYRPTDNFVVRLGYFRSTVNPDFRVLRRRTQYFIDLRSGNPRAIIREGNPELKPSKANNFDLDVAYYFKETPGMLRTGVFYKKIDNNFTNVLVADLPEDLRQRVLDYLEPLADTRPDLLDLPADTEFLLSRPENGEGGTIWGAEFELVRQLDFLPGFLGDFGVLGNATYTDGDFPTLVSGRDDEGNLTSFSLDRPLADQPEWVYNASVNYARGGFEGRLIYTYQSPTVDAYEVHDLNVIVPSYSTLDCRLSWSFEGPAGGLFTLFLEGDDLLRGSTESDIRYAIEPTFGRGDADYSFPRSLQFNGGRTVTAGIRARF